MSTTPIKPSGMPTQSIHFWRVRLVHATSELQNHGYVVRSRRC
jgi:hypothetical protein